MQAPGGVHEGGKSSFNNPFYRVSNRFYSTAQARGGWLLRFNSLLSETRYLIIKKYATMHSMFSDLYFIIYIRFASIPASLLITLYILWTILVVFINFSLMGDFLVNLPIVSSNI